MKKSIILLPCILISVFLFSQTPGIKWQQILDGAKIKYPLKSHKTIDNGILVVGVTSETRSGPNSDLWVEKFSEDGISQWSRTLGGSGREDFEFSYYETDGSLLIAATSNSTDGEVTNNHGDPDIWLVKLDGAGNLVWQKSFGGSDVEYFNGLFKSADGNYFITGSTDSNDGDITLNRGQGDAWILKISGAGTLLWQKTFGGSRPDYLGDLIELADGSLCVVGGTYSNDGDVSGFHGGEFNADIWLVKINPDRTINWQHCYGGMEDDWASLHLSPTGELYLLGSTESPTIPSYHAGALNEIYFARVSLEGDLLFEKCIGGSNSDASLMLQTIEADGSFVFNGETSSNDGDIVGHHGATGNDILLMKADKNGQVLWQAVLGGSGQDEVFGEIKSGERLTDYTAGDGSVIMTKDKGYLILGYTNSNDGDVEGFHEPIGHPARADLWVVKLSPNGQVEWRRCLGGSQTDVPKSILEFNANDYIIGAFTNSWNGDIGVNHGDWDGWLIRLGSVNRLMGTVFIDQNGNGIKDEADSLYSNCVIVAEKASVVKSGIPYKGNFVIEVDTGKFNTNLVLNRPYYTVTPFFHSSSFSSYFNKDSFSFALSPFPNKKDLSISVLPLTPVRPGVDILYEIHYRNVGTTVVTSGQIIFKKDSRSSFISAIPAISEVAGDSLKWNYTNLGPGEDRTIQLDLKMGVPPVVDINDTISSLAIITPVAGDLTPVDDTAKVLQRVTASFDPNDKAENHGGSIAPAQINAGEYLNYVIRFQNLGTDTAFIITVRDTLDNKLDWASFEMVSSSHPYQLEIDQANHLKWIFYGVNLPHSAVNEPASHGFIAYRIKPKAGLGIGATLSNRASIYFDFNLPVETNVVQTIVGFPIVLPLHLVTFDTRYLKPDALLDWSTADESNVGKFVIERGTDPVHFIPVGFVPAKGGSGISHYEFKDGLAGTSGDKFYYRLKIMDQDQKFTYSNIQLVKREGRVVNELVVNPNPVRGSIGQVWINFEKAITVNLSVVDMQGRTVYNNQQRISKGYNVIPIDFSILKSGSYFLQVKAEGKQMVTPFVVIQ